MLTPVASQNNWGPLDVVWHWSPWQQSSEVVAAAAVTDSDAPEVDAAGTGACLSSSSFSLLLLLLLLSTRGCRPYERQQNG